MLNNIMSMLGSMNGKNGGNNIMEQINKMMSEIKASGMNPQEYAAKLLREKGDKISPEKMDEFTKFAKQLGATDEQINSLLNNFEKK